LSRSNLSGQIATLPSVARDDSKTSAPRNDSNARDDKGAVAPIQLSDLTRRNLFRPLIAPPPPPPKVVELPPAPPPPPKVPLSQKASRLHLVGILTGDPLQAIIEDSQSQKTLYVTQGQAIDDIQIDKVTNDKVILKSDGETMELSL
jgi:type II secretory pathway component PulC